MVSEHIERYFTSVKKYVNKIKTQIQGKRTLILCKSEIRQYFEQVIFFPCRQQPFGFDASFARHSRTVRNSTKTGEAVTNFWLFRSGLPD